MPVVDKKETIHLGCFLKNAYIALYQEKKAKHTST